MDNRSLLTNYLSNLKVELFMADYNLCTTDWRDIDYTPDYSKFYFICEGEGWLKIGDMELYPQPGELILMPEGIKQSYSYVSGNPFRKYWCHFSAKVGDINLFKLLDFSQVSAVVDSNIIGRIFSELTSYHQSDHVYAHLLAKSKLMELLAYFIMNIDVDDITFKNLNSIKKLSKVLTYIDSNIEQNITIHELAEIAFMHPNYFIRFFKQKIGVPPIQYITRKKIAKAKDLLTSTTSSVSEISQQIGFSDLFYFSKQFKKIVGVTPTEFRKNTPIISH